MCGLRKCGVVGGYTSEAIGEERDTWWPVVECGEDCVGIGLDEGVVLWSTEVDGVEFVRGVPVWGLGVWRSGGGVGGAGEGSDERERFRVG